MTRPTRIELLKKFFPALGDTSSKGETEAAIALNTRASEVILANLIDVFDGFHARQGNGVLGLRLIDPPSAFYLTLDDLCSDLITADGLGDAGTASFLKSAVAVVKTNNFDQKVLVMIVDKSGSNIFPIPREYPAQGIQVLQEQATI